MEARLGKRPKNLFFAFLVFFRIDTTHIKLDWNSENFLIFWCTLMGSQVPQLPWMSVGFSIPLKPNSMRSWGPKFVKIRTQNGRCRNYFGMCRKYFGRCKEVHILASGKIILGGAKIILASPKRSRGVPKVPREKPHPLMRGPERPFRCLDSDLKHRNVILLSLNHKLLKNIANVGSF